MRKKLLAMCLAVGMSIIVTACGSSDSKTGDKETTVKVTEATTTANEEANKETTSQKVEEESTEKPTEKPTEEPTEEQTTEDTKVYDVYVNGKGYDKGTTLQFKVSLKANDKEFVICCPSFNIAYEGSTDPEAIYGFIEYDITDNNPLLFSNMGSDDYDKEYYYFWEYYEVLARWNNPDAPPLDITDGIYVYTATITFNEPGKYNISVTSGNGYEEMAEDFAKYDNCFTVEVIE